MIVWQLQTAEISETGLLALVGLRNPRQWTVLYFLRHCGAEVCEDEIVG
jgi:hypothetical protein